MATGFAVWVCGLDIAGPLWLLVVIAVFDAVLGTALGLLASGFARTEFQAVQFMPAFILPQFLLCGLLVPRDLLPPALEAVSNVLPLSYAVDAMKDVDGAGRPAQRGAAQPRRHRPVDRGVAGPGQPHPAPPHPLTPEAATGPGDPAAGIRPLRSRAAGGPGSGRSRTPDSLSPWTPVTCSGEPCSSCPTPT